METRTRRAVRLKAQRKIKEAIKLHKLIITKYEQLLKGLQLDAYKHNEANHK